MHQGLTSGPIISINIYIYAPYVQNYTLQKQRTLCALKGKKPQLLHSNYVEEKPLLWHSLKINKSCSSSSSLRI